MFFSFFMKSSFVKISVCLQFIKYGLVFMLHVLTGNKLGKGVLTGKIECKKRMIGGLENFLYK